MAHQSGFHAVVSFNPALYWTNTLMQVTHWDLFEEARQYEVPYMGSVLKYGEGFEAPVVPDFAEGKKRWRVMLVFLIPQELTADQMDVGTDEDRAATLFVNGADYWTGDVRIASYRTVAPLIGPIVATVRLLGRGALVQTVN